MIHHIAIGTTNPSHLAAFYLKIPGSILIKEHFYEFGSIRSVWIQFGSILLMLEDGKRESPKNLVFALETSKEAEWKEFLESITIVSRTDFTLYFQDPDGNGLGVSTYPEKLPSSLEMS
ncbi:VOC family protein [Leptospira paudalimensis]|uniref:VOC family protein n=1 Tax=Leptospira paudalimensis TaxID=2950024 RepID=A0ABT3MCV1_9LEPT|nr:VOC family protein [Leptospira paudalimensis]MCW7505861.1 VOC family protein [Leptospira paudalimensis]